MFLQDHAPDRAPDRALDRHVTYLRYSNGRLTDVPD